MHPTLLEIGSLRFHAYPTMLAVAFLVCTLAITRDLNRQNPPIALDTAAGVWAFFGALVGARAFCIIQYGELRDLWRAVFFWERGLVFYGGLIGGIAAVYVYALRHRLPKAPIADAVAPYLALGEAITRIGCFLNGCCWGSVTHVPWAVCFPVGSYAYEQQLAAHSIAASATCSAPVHPTQAYMSIGLLGVFLFIKACSGRRWPIGMSTALYAIAYGLLRFTVEVFRGDSEYSVAGRFTVSQAISLTLFAAGIVSLGLLSLKRSSLERPKKEQNSLG